MNQLKGTPNQSLLAATLGDVYKRQAGICSDTIATVPETKVNHGPTLAKVQLFSGLTEGELAFLLQRAIPRRYAAGEIVFSEGEPCSGMYVVESCLLYTSRCV